eukprot:SAG11_NODE_2516_length_3265_cov_3.032533_4_plen_67_part_00
MSSNYYGVIPLTYTGRVSYSNTTGRKSSSSSNNTYGSSVAEAEAEAEAEAADEQRPLVHEAHSQPV